MRSIQILVICLLLSFPIPLLAKVENAPTIGKETGLPLPRFVSIKSRSANIRVGPSNTHQVKWIYKKKGYPVQIISEFQHWRQIMDVDGEIGWVHEALLAGKRNILTINKEVILMRRYPNEAGRPVARIEGGVIGSLVECQKAWCYIKVGTTLGWLEKSNIWGTFPDEVIEK
jgi:SH3-like domain-containing protein